MVNYNGTPVEGNVLMVIKSQAFKRFGKLLIIRILEAWCMDACTGGVPQPGALSQ